MITKWDIKFQGLFHWPQDLPGAFKAYLQRCSVHLLELMDQTSAIGRRAKCVKVAYTVPF